MTNRILKTSRGTQHGPINRLISPLAEGDDLKPFIFLDYINTHIQAGFGFPMHPHSGLATLTWQPNCDIKYEDTTGQNGILKAGGLEWMNAGGGAWHRAQFATGGNAVGFQLWVAMPPTIEDGAALGQYIAPQDVPTQAILGGQIKLFLGELTQFDAPLTSPIQAHQDMTYFVLTLQAGAKWTYNMPATNDVAFAVVFEGDGEIDGTSSMQELVQIGGNEPITFSSGAAKTQILIGSGKKHPYPLITGTSSVHTSPAALERGQQRIRAIGEQLMRDGRL